MTVQPLQRIAPYLQVAPLTLVLLVFFGIPLARRRGRQLLRL